MIQWPQRAKAAIKKLFEPIQDIDVYVEDTNDEVFYRTLLNKVSDGKVCIARVFALGGRSAVIEAATQHDFSQRRALFLIDGDLNWVRGSPPPNVVGLHQHNAYCVENLLLCKKALAFVLSQDAVLSEEEAEKTLNFDTWVSSIQSPLITLFAAYGTAHEVAPALPTVSKGVGVLCTSCRKTKHTSLDSIKANQESEIILSATEKIGGKDLVTHTYSRILHRLQSLPFPLHGVSGKDFLLPLADFLLQSHGCRIKRRSLRVRLATAGDMNRFSSLHEALLNAARGYA